MHVTDLNCPMHRKFCTDLVQERNDILENKNLTWTRIKKSKCWYTRYSDSKYALKSYNEVVALFDADENSMYIFGNYSCTTKKHINKFHRVCMYLMYPHINMYNLGIDDYFAERK